jgi:hypothetical protein
MSVDFCLSSPAAAAQGSSFKRREIKIKRRINAVYSRATERLPKVVDNIHQCQLADIIDVAMVSPPADSLYGTCILYRSSI